MLKLKIELCTLSRPLISSVGTAGSGYREQGELHIAQDRQRVLHFPLYLSSKPASLASPQGACLWKGTTVTMPKIVKPGESPMLLYYHMPVLSSRAWGRRTWWWFIHTAESSMEHSFDVFIVGVEYLAFLEIVLTQVLDSSRVFPLFLIFFMVYKSQLSSLKIVTNSVNSSSPTLYCEHQNQIMPPIVFHICHHTSGLYHL